MPTQRVFVATRLTGTTAIYTLLLVYAASTATTTLACIAVVLAAPDALRAPLTKRVNLVAWERRVASLVRAAFRNA